MWCHSDIKYDNKKADHEIRLSEGSIQDGYKRFDFINYNNTIDYIPTSDPCFTYEKQITNVLFLMLKLMKQLFYSSQYLIGHGFNKNWTYILRFCRTM